MSGEFVHLHVASGFSLRHGASHPQALVRRAADLGQHALALTDRDGAYGAVHFALACRDAGIRPILGVDLAVARQDARDPTDRGVHELKVETRRTPARGGSSVDPRHPRVVLLGRGGAGWASVCRVISEAHLTGERGSAVADLEVLRRRTEGVVALLGPDSALGRAVARRRPDLARAELARWQSIYGSGLCIEVVSHRSRDSGQAAADVSGQARGLHFSSIHAARMLAFAKDHGVRVVLSNAVRYAEASQAAVADVLDAVRRLVPLDARHLDRPNAEGYVKSTAEMVEIAREISEMAGLGPSGAKDLLASTLELAEECMIDPVEDLGIGSVHVPELDVLLAGRAAGLGGAGTGAVAKQAEEDRVRAQRMLRERCESALAMRSPGGSEWATASARLSDELDVVRTLGFAGYFLTVAEVVDLIKGHGVRVAARGSGAGSLITHLLGISAVDPMRHGLLMERFMSPLRRALPDIDIDVESERRTEMYGHILDRFGGDRCVCVSMMDTYRVRHAIRDVGAALGMPLGDLDLMAKAFPHIRARDARAALSELPELRRSELGRRAARGELDGFLTLVEAMDGLPRHVALHPCGVLLSDASLLDRTPVEASWQGFPMSQFDKDAVEEMGFLKLDVLGIRMQSAMAHAVNEVLRTEGPATTHARPSPELADGRIDLDRIPFDDEETFELIRSTRTLGCFQIESPGQRELLGKFAPEVFGDLIIDISLFRPGPVKSDMISPFLRARQGWAMPSYVHPDLKPALEETCGVVVFHEQVLRIVSVMTGCSLAEADETRRNLGSPEGQAGVRAWFYPKALGRGYALPVVEEVWEILRAFASFGFCKAHAAAFAVPTYQSAWLKTHHPAAFLSGVLTHDPGMYPKRLILDDARNMGIPILGLDVNKSRSRYCLEEQDGGSGVGRWGIRLSLAEVKGISDHEVARLEAGQPYSSLQDTWHRAQPSRPVLERLILTGAFDGIYGIDCYASAHVRGRTTRRDLLLDAADLSRMSGSRRGRAMPRNISAPVYSDPAVAAAAQSQSAAAVPSESAVQMALSLDGEAGRSSGLPEMTGAEQVRAELDSFGLDVSRHVISFYEPLLHALAHPSHWALPPLVRSNQMMRTRSKEDVLIVGVKVATQTPPIRSGRRVVFLTLDDATGPVDATFFEDAQGPYAATVFHSWLLLVRGEVRRTGPRGISVRATGCWDLPEAYGIWQEDGLGALADYIAHVPEFADESVAEGSHTEPGSESARGNGSGGTSSGGMGQRRRVLIHASGFRQSPFADVKPAGEDPKKPGAAAKPKAAKPAPAKLWHSSPHSSGW